MSSSKMRKLQREALSTLSTLLCREDRNLDKLHETDGLRGRVLEEREHLSPLLSRKEELAMRLYFGLGIGQPHILDEIAKIGMNGSGADRVIKTTLKALAEFNSKNEAHASVHMGMRGFLIANCHHLPSLKTRHRKILQLRFGLLDGEMLTLNKVAQSLADGETPLCRERIKQLEFRAVFELASKVFTANGNDGLRDFLQGHRTYFPRYLKYADATFLEHTFHLGSSGRSGNREGPELGYPAKIKIGKSLIKIIDAHYSPSIGNWIKMNPALMKFVYDNFHLIGELKHEEEKSLELRFGIGTKTHSYDEIGEIMGVAGNHPAKQLVQRGIISLFKKAHGPADTQAEEYCGFRELMGEMGSFATLTPLQQMALTLRFGLDGEKAHSQDKTSKRMRIKRARLINLEKEAIYQLLKKSKIGIAKYLAQHSDAVRELPPDKRQALELHFGLEGNQKHSLTELQRAMGISSFSRTRKILEFAACKVVAAAIEKEAERRSLDPVKKLMRENPHYMDALANEEREIISLAFGLEGKRKHMRSEIVTHFAEQGISIGATAIFQRKQNAIVKLIAEKTRRETILEMGPWLAAEDSPGLFLSLEPETELTIRVRLGMGNWRSHTLTEVQKILAIASVTDTKQLIENALSSLEAAPAQFSLETEGKEFVAANPQLMGILPIRMRKIANFWTEKNKKQLSTKDIAEKMDLFPGHVDYLKGKIFQLVRENAPAEEAHKSGEPFVESIMAAGVVRA
ncbi:MAG: hypothetical protein GY852_04205 [bacterium]|nr:hypothetical protein [bacterium]